MCIYCTNEYIEWNNKNIGKISTAPMYCKILFMASNIFFLSSQPLLFLIFITSSIFHGYQCFYNDTVTIKLLWLDTILTTITALIYTIIKYTSIGIFCLLLWIPAIICYYYGTSKQGYVRYMILHSFWHIIAGLLLQSL